jgi:hypothetical protein
MVVTHAGHFGNISRDKVQNLSYLLNLFNSFFNILNLLVSFLSLASAVH